MAGYHIPGLPQDTQRRGFAVCGFEGGIIGNSQFRSRTVHGSKDGICEEGFIIGAMPIGTCICGNPRSIWHGEIPVQGIAGCSVGEHPVPE